MAAPPSEREILQSYLLHQSPLPTIVPFSQFQTLLSASVSKARYHPELKRLYRDLQFQRVVTIDHVRRRIDAECRRSTTLLGRLVRDLQREEGERRSRKRKRDPGDVDGAEADHLHPSDNDDDDDDDDDGCDCDLYLPQDADIDTQLEGPRGSTLPNPTKNSQHTTASLIAAMSAASQDLQAEIQSLESQIDRIHDVCQERVGGLSDLRYGKLSQVGRQRGDATEGGIEKDVLDALTTLQDTLKPGDARSVGHDARSSRGEQDVGIER